MYRPCASFSFNRFSFSQLCCNKIADDELSVTFLCDAIYLLAAGALGASLLGVIRDARAEDETPRAAYFCFEASDANDLMVKSNAAAQRGWEMVAATAGRASAGTWCFKQRR